MSLHDEGGGHFIRKCTCGAVIAQCRCFAPTKTETIVRDGCDDCRNKKSSDLRGDVAKLTMDAMALCWEIEKLPASEQQTACSVRASNLHKALIQLQATHGLI